MMTFDIPTIVRFPIITFPTPLLIVEKSSITDRSPNSNSLNGKTSNLVLLLIMLRLPRLCLNGFKKIRTHNLGLCSFEGIKKAKAIFFNFGFDFIFDIIDIC